MPARTVDRRCSLDGNRFAAMSKFGKNCGTVGRCGHQARRRGTRATRKEKSGILQLAAFREREYLRGQRQTEICRTYIVEGARSLPGTIWLLPLRDSGLNSSTENLLSHLAKLPVGVLHVGSTYSVSCGVRFRTRDCLDMLSTWRQNQPATDQCQTQESLESSDRNSGVSSIGAHENLSALLLAFNYSVGTACPEMKPSSGGTS
jgi:hypothetical protein